MNVSVGLAPTFPVGTSVSAYRFISDNPDGQAPPVGATASGVVGSDSSVTFNGLSADTAYWVGADIGGWRYTQLVTRAFDENLDEPLAGSGITITSAELAGHSWVAGFGVTNAKYNWPDRLAKLCGGVTATKVALSGAVAASPAATGGVGQQLQSASLATDLTAGPYMTPGGLKVVMHGFNDFNQYFDAANTRPLIEASLRALYSRMLAARVILALEAGPAINQTLTYGTSWGPFPDTTVSAGLGFSFSSTNGATIDIPLDAKYNGEAVTVLLPVNGAGASFTCTASVGGVTKGSFSTSSAAAAIVAAGVAGAVQCLRLPAGTLAAGAQTLRLTYTSLSTYCTFGGLMIEGSAPLLLPLFPRRPGVSVSVAGTSAVAVYGNARTLAASAGFPTAVQVDLEPAMCPNYGSARELDDDRYWFDSTHPNNLGCARITSLLLEAVRNLPASATAEMT